MVCVVCVVVCSLFCVCLCVSCCVCRVCYVVYILCAVLRVLSMLCVRCWCVVHVLRFQDVADNTPPNYSKKQNTYHSIPQTNANIPLNTAEHRKHATTITTTCHKQKPQHTTKKHNTPTAHKTANIPQQKPEHRFPECHANLRVTSVRVFTIAPPATRMSSHERMCL